MLLKKRAFRTFGLKTICFVVWCLCIAAQGACAKSLDSLYDSFINNFEFLPEYYLKSDLSAFAFQKNAFFREQYLAESNTGLEFMFLSYRQLLYSVWDVKFKIGLGEVPGNVVFSVLNIHFIITPTIELRLPSLNAMTGLEHQCVHEVDRKSYPVVHWNAPFLGIASKNMRDNIYWIPLASPDGWTTFNRLSWYGGYYYYLKEFFDLATPEKLSGFNAATHELRLDGRYAFYKRKSWIVAFHDKIRLGLYEPTPGVADHSGVFWREELGFESFFSKGKRGGMIYCRYYFDDLPDVEGLPIFSKDRLLEIGVSFFN